MVRRRTRTRHHRWKSGLPPPAVPRGSLEARTEHVQNLARCQSRLPEKCGTKGTEHQRTVQPRQLQQGRHVETGRPRRQQRYVPPHGPRRQWKQRHVGDGRGPEREWKRRATEVKYSPDRDAKSAQGIREKRIDGRSGSIYSQVKNNPSPFIQKTGPTPRAGRQISPSLPRHPPRAHVRGRPLPSVGSRNPYPRVATNESRNPGIFRVVEIFPPPPPSPRRRTRHVERTWTLSKSESAHLCHFPARFGGCTRLLFGGCTRLLICGPREQGSSSGALTEAMDGVSARAVSVHHQTAFKHGSLDEARAPTASTAQEVKRKEDVTRRAEVRLPRGSGTSGRSGACRERQVTACCPTHTGCKTEPDPCCCLGYEGRTSDRVFEAQRRAEGE